MTVVARLTELHEWLSELDRDRDLCGGIVRATKVARPVMEGTITRVHVEAAYFVAKRDEIVRHVDLIGDLWGMERDEKVQEEASAQLRRIEEAIAGRGLELRAGIYEEKRVS